MSANPRTPWQQLRRRWRRRALRLGRALGLLPPTQPETLGILFGYAPIARYLGLSRDQARRLVRRGAIPAFTLDGVPCARRSSLVSYLNGLEAYAKRAARKEVHRG